MREAEDLRRELARIDGRSYAAFRRTELAAAINRLRTLSCRQRTQDPSGS